MIALSLGSTYTLLRYNFLNAALVVYYISVNTLAQFLTFDTFILPLSSITVIFCLTIMMIMNKRKAIMVLSSSFTKHTCNFFRTDKEISL